jgi:chitinase
MHIDGTHKGTYDYRALPLPGASVYRDHSSIASWSYDSQKKEMISFDDEATVFAKTAWILDLGLGGAMYWELSGTFLRRLDCVF